MITHGYLSSSPYYRFSTLYLVFLVIKTYGPWMLETSSPIYNKIYLYQYLYNTYYVT